jgi:hypothetical protein
MLPEWTFEDFTVPDSTTMPPEFHGTWLTEWNESLVISADEIISAENVHRVVGVWFSDEGNIVLNSGLVISPPTVAVITFPTDETKEQIYSLQYFGLSEDGDSLVDLENMEVVSHRSR